MASGASPGLATKVSDEQDQARPRAHHWEPTCRAVSGSRQGSQATQVQSWLQISFLRASPGWALAPATQGVWGYQILVGPLLDLKSPF